MPKLWSTLWLSTIFSINLKVYKKCQSCGLHCGYQQCQSAPVCWRLQSWLLRYHHRCRFFIVIIFFITFVTYLSTRLSYHHIMSIAKNFSIFLFLLEMSFISPVYFHCDVVFEFYVYFYFYLRKYHGICKLCRKDTFQSSGSGVIYWLWCIMFSYKDSSVLYRPPRQCITFP